MKENKKIEIAPNNKNENHLELDKNNLLQDLGKNYINNESSFLRNNEDNELKKDNNSIPKNNRICDEDKYKKVNYTDTYPDFVDSLNVTNGTAVFGLGSVSFV